MKRPNLKSGPLAPEGERARVRGRTGKKLGPTWAEAAPEQEVHFQLEGRWWQGAV